MGWPGLSTECKDICEKTGLKNSQGAVSDKQAIEENIYYHNYKEMKEDMERQGQGNQCQTPGVKFEE